MLSLFFFFFFFLSHCAHCFTYPGLSLSFLFSCLSKILSFSLLNFFIPGLLHNFNIFPPPVQFYYFPSSFLNSLPLNFIIFPPHSFLFSSSSTTTIFVIFPPQSLFPSSSTILLFSLLLLLIYFIYFSIHKYIDLISTQNRLYIDPASTLDSTFFNTAS